MSHLPYHRQSSHPHRRFDVRNQRKYKRISYLRIRSSHRLQNRIGLPESIRSCQNGWTMKLKVDELGKENLQRLKEEGGTIATSDETE
jgi:hypothetical protein